MARGTNTNEIRTAAISPYLLITLKASESKNVSLSDMQNLNTLFNTLTADDKFSFLNRGNLTQPIHLHLYQKQNFFPNFFLHF